MSYKQQAGKLAGYDIHNLILNKHILTGLSCRQIALLKSFSTSSGQETARDAVQVFGGRGITKTGMGRHIEHVRHGSPLLSSVLILVCVVSPHNSV